MAPYVTASALREKYAVFELRYGWKLIDIFNISSWKARDVCFSLLTSYGLNTDKVYLMNMSQH